MSEAARHPDLEALLRRALAPVEPPADLAERLEGRLTEITELAAEELEAWEIGAMRDPRNWARPAAAVARRSAARAGPTASPRPPSAPCGRSSTRRGASVADPRPPRVR
jgi:hypothetical protein